MKKASAKKDSDSKKTLVTREAASGKVVKETNLPNLLKNRPFKIKFY